VQHLQLSKLAYYSDMVIYPAAIGALVAVNFAHGSPKSSLPWLAAVSAGLLLWTLMEYFLHRITLHGRSYFAPMHGQHHASPLAFIGTPTWMSTSILTGAVMLPTWLFFGFNIADGLLVGVMVGYWWYGIVHHLIHHRAQQPRGSYLNDLRAWHMRHHYSPKGGNFGVTSPLWDYVFGTVIRTRDKSSAAP
jgi:sterol desaturase/sphingolipid hydroxylase (fatty acid hydroxylase superfamily)